MHEHEYARCEFFPSISLYVFIKQFYPIFALEIPPRLTPLYSLLIQVTSILADPSLYPTRAWITWIYAVLLLRPTSCVYCKTILLSSSYCQQVVEKMCQHQMSERQTGLIRPLLVALAFRIYDNIKSQIQTLLSQPHPPYSLRLGGAV